MSRRSEEQDFGEQPLEGRKGLPKRWSEQRKARGRCCGYYAGEDIGEVSREVRVAPPELERPLEALGRVESGDGSGPPAGDGVCES